MDGCGEEGAAEPSARFSSIIRKENPSLRWWFSTRRNYKNPPCSLAWRGLLKPMFFY